MIYEIYVLVILFILLFVSIYFLILYINVDVSKIRRKITKKPNILFIIPAFNEEKTIKQTILSILSIDYPKDKYTIIVVDDGSKDRTFEEASSVARNYDNVIVLRKQNSGKASSVNYALKYALKSNIKFDFFAIIDADTYLPKNYCDIVECFDEETMAVVPKILPEKSMNIIEKLQEVEYSLSNFSKLIFAYYDSWFIVNTGAMIRREALDIVGFMDPTEITEDLEYGLRIIRSGYKVKHCPFVTITTDVPKTLKKLILQRVRWYYGWFVNTIKYYRVFNLNRVLFIALFMFYYSLIGIILLFILNLSKFVDNYMIYLSSIDLHYYAYKLMPSLSISIWQYLSNSIHIYSAILFVIILFYHILVRKHNDIVVSYIFSILYIISFSFILGISRSVALYHLITRNKKWWR